MALNPKEVEDLLESSKKLLGLWIKVNGVFRRSFSGGELTKDQENDFLNTKSDISRVFRTISDRLPPGLKFDGDKMMEMLKNAMTMEHLRNQPLNEKQNIFALWHRIYIKLTRTVGALEVMQSGYYPHLHRARMKSAEPAKQAARPSI